MENKETQNNDLLPKHIPGLFPEVKQKKSSNTKHLLIGVILLCIIFAFYFFFTNFTFQLPFSI